MSDANRVGLATMGGGMVVERFDHELAKVIRNIADINTKATEARSVTLKVTTRKGISLGEEVKVPNPVRLAPFRTFAEITQPSSLFILRLRRVDGDLPQCALYECGDNGWQLEAIQSMQDFISVDVEGVPVIA